MIDSLRRVTKIEVSSVHFRDRAPLSGPFSSSPNSGSVPSAGTSPHSNDPLMTSYGPINGPTEVLELLPLQPVSVEIRCSLAVFSDPSAHMPPRVVTSSPLPNSLSVGAAVNAPSGSTTSSMSHPINSGISSTATSAAFFTNTTIPTPPPMSLSAARYFLVDNGEDNICDAWVNALKTMILVPFLSDMDGVAYGMQLQQAAGQCPHSITSKGFLSMAAQMDKTPLLPPQEMTGVVENYFTDYRPLVADPSQPLGAQILDGLVKGTIPLPSITFRIDFTVPNTSEGPKLFGVMMTLLNSPSIVYSTPLPLGCLSLGAVLAPAVLDHLVGLSCTSRLVGPNKVLVACRLSSRVPRRGAYVEEALYPNLFITNLLFDTPSTCAGKSQGSMAQLPYDPQQRLAATHHTAPLIQALVKSIDVTPLRQAGDIFPITLRKHETYNFVFMIEMKPELAYLAHYAAKHAASIPPQMSGGVGGGVGVGTVLSPQHYKRSMVLSRGGGAQKSVGFVSNTTNGQAAAAGQSNATQQAAGVGGGGGGSVLVPIAYGTIGIGGQIHERRLNEHQQLQQRMREQQKGYCYGANSGGGAPPLAPNNPHQRTGSLFRYKSGGGALHARQDSNPPSFFNRYTSNSQQTANSSIAPTSPAETEPFFSPTSGVRSVRNTRTLSGGEAFESNNSNNSNNNLPARGGTYSGNSSTLTSSYASPAGVEAPTDAVGYSHLSVEDLWINHILTEVLETTIVLSYEIDANKGRGGGGKKLAATTSAPQPLAQGADPASSTSGGGVGGGGGVTPTTVSLRWQTAVKWSFSSRQYDAKGNIIPLSEGVSSPSTIGVPALGDHDTSTDSWMPQSSYTSPQ